MHVRRILLICSGLYLWFLCGVLSAQDLGDITALLQRGSTNKIRLSLSVQSLDATDFTTFELGSFGEKSSQNGIDMLTKFLDICVFDSTATDKKCGAAVLKARYTNNNNLDKTPVLQISQDYTASMLDTATVFVLDPVTNIYKLKTSIEIKSINDSKPFSTKTSISLRLSKGVNTDVSFDGEKTVTLAVAVDDTPGDSSIIKSKSTLTAIWTENEQVTLEDGSMGSADGALGFVIAEDEWGTKNFPVQSYDRTDTSKEIKYASACSISAEADASSCTISCVNQDTGEALPTPYYAKKDDLDAAGFDAQESGANSSSLSFSGLSKDKRYAVVLQYQPDGLQRSCLVAKPSDALILTELGGGPEPTIKDPRCFIATAAYGSSLDPHINSLRWFRDRVLLITSPGRALVQIYYHYSPSLASYIQTRPTLQLLTRSLLWLPVMLIELSRQFPIAMIISTGFAITSAIILSRRRANRASA